MITREEMYRFADMLDKEYAEVIKPILLKTKEITESVLACVKTDAWKTIARRHGSSEVYKVEFIRNSLVENLFERLRYSGVQQYNYEMRQYDTPNSLIGWLHYSEVAYPTGQLKQLFSKENVYAYDDLNVINTITEIKKEFENIKDAYNQLFANDGKLFKIFVNEVSVWYNYHMRRDKEYDKALYALFNQEAPKKTIRITVNIEEI